MAGSGVRNRDPGLDQIKTKLIDPHWISEVLALYSATPDELRAALMAAEKHADTLQGPTERIRQRLGDLVSRIVLSDTQVQIEVRPEALLKRAIREGGKKRPWIAAAAPLWRRPGEHAIVLPARGPSSSSADPSLLKAIARAHVWFDELVRGEATSVAQLAAREGITDRYVSGLLKLAFVAPAIIARLVEGRVGVLTSTKRLTHDVDLPFAWAEQQRLLATADF
jgi:site-specific DNA recombinase